MPSQGIRPLAWGCRRSPQEQGLQEETLGAGGSAVPWAGAVPRGCAVRWAPGLQETGVMVLN